MPGKDQKMQRDEFSKEVKERILEFMPKEFSEHTAKVDRVAKQGGRVLYGLSLHKGEYSAAPIVYLEEYYDRLKDGMPLEQVLKSLAERYEDLYSKVPKIKEPDLSYDRIKGDLRIKMLYEMDNQELLKDVYHVSAGCGYVVIVYADLSEQLMEGACVNIRNDMIKAYGYDKDTLVLDALSNSFEKYPPTLTHIEEEVIMFAAGKTASNLLEEGCEDKAEGGILVLTTSDRLYGASAICYPGIRERIAKTVCGSYYVLPSSVHELLICPDDGRYTSRDLADMVKAVNDTQVAKDEQLGNRVLYYDAMTRSLDVACDMDKENKVLEGPEGPEL